MTNFSRSLLVAGALMCASPAVVNVEVNGLTLSKSARFLMVNRGNNYRRARRVKGMSDEQIAEINNLANSKKARELAGLEGDNLGMLVVDNHRAPTDADFVTREADLGSNPVADSQDLGRLVGDEDDLPPTGADSASRPADVGLPTRLDSEELDSHASDEQEQRPAFDNNVHAELRNHLRQGDSRFQRHAGPRMDSPARHAFEQKRGGNL